MNSEPREKARRWVSALLSLSIILVPILFLFSFNSSGTSNTGTAISTGYTTDAQVLFNSFIGLAVILILLLVPIFYLFFRRERKSDLR